MFIRRFEVLAGNKTCEETYRKRHIDIEYITYMKTIHHVCVILVTLTVRYRI